jgi:predicted nucleic acid-binding protein
MILIDTSAWVEFFRRSGDQAIKQQVAAYIDADSAAYSCPVYFELLAGVRNNEQQVVEEALSLCERLIFEPTHWERAAELERRLRQRGVTIPRDDLFVAAVALEKQLPLFCHDRHFSIIQEKGAVPLRIV